MIKKHNGIFDLQIIYGYFGGPLSKREHFGSIVMFSFDKENLVHSVSLGPDHLQLTLLNWDTESVLALNKKLKFPIRLQFFYLVPKHFWCPK